MSLYDDLKVDKNASKDNIMSAYRKEAMKHHPDRGGDVSDFDKATKAYKILIDDKSRLYYDETGKVDELGELTKQAMNCLGNLFVDIISNMKETIFEIDLIHHLKKVVLIKDNEINSRIQQIKVESKFYEKILTKLHSSKKDQDIFTNIVKDRIAKLKTETIEMKKLLELNKEMKTILKNYKWNYVSNNFVFFNQTTANTSSTTMMYS